MCKKMHCGNQQQQNDLTFCQLNMSISHLECDDELFCTLDDLDFIAFVINVWLVLALFLERRGQLAQV